MRAMRKALAVGPAPAAEDLRAAAASPEHSAYDGQGAKQTGRWSPSRLTLVRLAMAVGLTALAVALIVVLTRSPLTLAGSNGIPANVAVAFTGKAEVTCEDGGTVPQGTQAIRVSLSANTGPQVNVDVFSGSKLVTEGERDSGWGIDETVTVPVKRVARTITNAHICTKIGVPVEPLQINGAKVRTPAGPTAILLRMEYLRPGTRSWLSLAAPAASAIGLVHAPGGSWVAYLLIAAMLVVTFLAMRLIYRELAARAPTRRMSMRGVHPPRALDRPLRAARRIPRAAWVCALVAFLSATCWSFVSPPFQVPDEPSHFAYVQLLAETGRLPNSSSGAVSPEELQVTEALHQKQIEWHPEVPAFTSPAARAELHQALTARLSRVGPGGAGVAASEPPLYYALAGIAYDLGSSGTLLDRLELIRLLSALMAALTALFVFLFVRETLPRVPWAWTVGGLAAAVTPLLGFTSSAVTPEAMFYTISAAIFFCLARAFKRGLTRKRALALGVLTAAGFLTKLSFIGLAPGVILGLVILGFRGDRVVPAAVRSRRTFGAMALALAIGLAPVFVLIAKDLLEHHRVLGLVSKAAERSSEGEPITVDLSYLWEFYLPHLPGMTNYFPDLSTFRQLWFDRAVGFYGWLDTPMPLWLDNLALIPVGLMGVFAARTLLAQRSALRAHLPEIVVYFVMGVGLMALIGQAFYQNRSFEGSGWAQPRYLVPLLPLAAVLLAAAARGAGRRLGPAVGVLIVILFIAQDVFGQLQTIARFY
ncbi:MAG TPA: DUF2142 domain-containing protein [Solirubrobacteraceae bacterium]|jgi:hypothetical protein|nr:DUF2142 domain-containing protein [Solirubrobacteraceae bacterium]